jgi:hypothetical protein
MVPGRPRLAVRRHRKVAVVLAVSIALALSGLGIEWASASTRSRLAVSLKSDRSNLVRLDGSTLKGQIYILVRDSESLRKVDFYLDSQPGTKPPDQTDTKPPFDFAGAAADGTAVAYDTAGLADGSHSIRVVLTWSDGTTSSRRAKFTVANGVTTTSTTARTATMTTAPPATTTPTAPAATTTAPAATSAAPAATRQSQEAFEALPGTTTKQPVPAHLVPATLTGDCSVDVTSALMKWIGSIPDNSVLSFRSAQCYRIDGTVELNKRSGLTLQGNGSTFKSRASMVGGNKADDQRAMFRVIDSSAISFENMAIIGSYAHGGTFDASLQHAHAIDLRGTSVVVENVSMSNVAGDCLYFGLGNDNVTKSSGSAHDSTCKSIGRSGISVAAGKGVTVKRMTLDKVGFATFNVEPNAGQGWGASNILFESNIIKSYRLHAFSIVENAPISDVTFANNRVVGQGLKAAVGNGNFRPRNITFRGNSSDTRLSTVAFNAEKVDYLTITGNDVPLTSGTMASVERSCKVSVTDNTFVGGYREVATINPVTSC